MEKNLSTVTISVDEYNEMRDRLADLERANGELTEVIENTKDMDDSRVITKEVYMGEDEDGDEYCFVKYSFENFNDVRAEVEETMKVGIEGTTKKLSELQQSFLEMQCRVAELYSRNWWQRLLNK